jgi:putative FmdB family regulatory protein
MPTYQYRCTECGNELEAVQKFTDSALTDCPDCTGQLRKVFNAVGVVFKGSGFYRTDSRADKKNGAGSGKNEGGSESTEKKSADASTSSDTSSDKKPEKKKPDASSGKQPVTAGTGSSSASNAKGSSTAA